MNKFILLILLLTAVFSFSFHAEATERCAGIVSRLSNGHLFTGSYGKLVKFPRDPENFMHWWRMLDYVKDADGVAVSNPFSAREMNQLKSSFQQVMDRTARNQKDMFALGSIPHIEEHMQFADMFRTEIQSMGIDIEYYSTLAFLHDAGKFVPDAQVLELADGNFVMGRVAWHDQSTASYLLAQGKKHKIDYTKMEHLLSDIIGHNDGAGIQGSFWVSVYPGYGMPRRLEGDILTLFDRFGQGNWVGAEKITKQVSSSKSFKDAVTEGYLNNPTMTKRQLDATYERALSRLRQRTEGRSRTVQRNLRKIYDYAVSAQQETIAGFRRMKWDNKTQSFVIGSGRNKVSASNLEQFFSDAFQSALKL